MYRYQDQEGHEQEAKISRICNLIRKMKKHDPLSPPMLLQPLDRSQPFQPYTSFAQVTQLLDRFEQTPSTKPNKPNKKIPKWKKQLLNSSVYVTGLPADISLDELVAHFVTAGSIRDEFGSDVPRVRIYRDDEHSLCKGDATISFEKELSVPMAVQLLDNSQIRPGIRIRVCPAENISSDKVSKRERETLGLAQLNLLKAKQRKKQVEKFSYAPLSESRGKQLRIVILKHMFEGTNVDWQGLEREIGLECQTIGGPIEKLTIFREHPDGVVAVKFREGVGADKCVEVMNGRWFNARKISADYFDGVTNYKYVETEEEELKRFQAFDE